jgi:hypothetical protein
VVELELNVTADNALAECRRRGLVVRSERELAGRAGSHHWHLSLPGRTGTLELSEWQGRVWVKVHPRRDGGWASAGPGRDRTCDLGLKVPRLHASFLA